MEIHELNFAEVFSFLCFQNMADDMSENEMSGLLRSYFCSIVVIQLRIAHSTMI